MLDETFLFMFLYYGGTITSLLEAHFIFTPHEKNIDTPTTEHSLDTLAFQGHIFIPLSC